MDKKHRLAGIDLLKGVAAYAVVFIHSQSGEFGEPSYWTLQLSRLFGLAVPFFLATSFYLTINKIFYDHKPYSLAARLKFIIIPYLSWSLIYFLARCAKYLATGDILKIGDLFSNLLPMIFLGSTAVQLYFLPLLITGIIGIQFSLIFLRNNIHNIKILIILIISSTGLYQLILTSGNSFDLGSNTAFVNLVQSTIPDLNNYYLIRLILIYICWLLKCLPYIFIAILLNHPIFTKNYFKLNQKYTIIFLGLFAILQVIEISRILKFPLAQELCAAYVLLLFGISLSNQLKENYIITSLGVCSFGIYLMHHLIIELIRPIISKIYPVSIDTVPVLICTLFSFSLTWLIVFYLRKSQKYRKLLFGG